MGVTFHQGNRFKLPVIGCIKFWQDRPIPQGAIVKQARLVRRSTGWYIMLTLQWDVSIPDTIPHGNSVGIDIGLTNFVATSNGLLIKKNEIFCAPQNASLNCCKSALLEKDSGQIIGKELRKNSHCCMNMLQTVEKIGIASCHIKSATGRGWCLSKTLIWLAPKRLC